MSWMQGGGAEGDEVGGRRIPYTWGGHGLLARESGGRASALREKWRNVRFCSGVPVQGAGRCPFFQHFCFICGRRLVSNVSFVCFKK